MGQPNFSEDFKRDAVHQITVRGYAVREVSERLGVSTYSLYKWMKLYAKAASQTSSVDHEAENRRLKRELARMTEERDILKKAAAYFAKDARGSTRSLPSIALSIRYAGCVVASISIPAGSMHGLKIH